MTRGLENRQKRIVQPRKWRVAETLKIKQKERSLQKKKAGTSRRGRRS